MRQPKAFIMSLALLLFVAPLTSKVMAQGPDPGSAAEERDYAGRESECSTIDQFTGGGAEGILIGLAIILAVVFIIYYLVIIDKERHHSMRPVPHEPGACPVGRLAAHAR